MTHGKGIPVPPQGTPDRSKTWMDGKWYDGDVPLMSAMSHASWLASVVFDGARAFAGQAPDLDLHCQRAIRSAEMLGLKAIISAKEIERLSWEGIARFPKDAELYVRPLFWADDGFLFPDPESTRFALTLFEAAVPPPKGFSACLSPFRRPSPETAPTEAKAACLYPNVSRMLFDASKRGFDTAVVTDLNGNVAEFASSNLFIAKDGIVSTPVINGTFLNGITRQRVIQLLRKAGVDVRERSIAVREVHEADELFSTGNYSKVTPCTRFEQRNLQPGPFYAQARELYFAYAKTATAPR
jgi:branched-chain amino acid aminotransferase